MPGTNGTNDYEIPGAKLKTAVPSDKYKEGWDRIFGSKPTINNLITKKIRVGHNYGSIIQRSL